MHKNIDKIKNLEGSPKVIKKLFSKGEIEKFLELYKNLPTTVHNKKQNVIKKRWLKNFNKELENIFYEKVKNEKPEIMESILSSGKLEKDTEESLIQIIEEYKKTNA